MIVNRFLAALSLVNQIDDKRAKVSIESGLKKPKHVLLYGIDYTHAANRCPLNLEKSPEKLACISRPKRLFFLKRALQTHVMLLVRSECLTQTRNSTLVQR